MLIFIYAGVLNTNIMKGDQKIYKIFEICRKQK
jgi:hypothetical protein